MWYSLAFALLAGLALLLQFGVICALLRQLNQERLERETILERLRELALRTRWVQLQAEEGVSREMVEPLEMQLFPDPPSTVAEVEGN